MIDNINHTIHCFNRFEIKYLLTLSQAECFKSALHSYLLPDDHGDNNGRYTLASQYYDSPDLQCYWEKLDGVKFRRKLRIRHYENGDLLCHDTPVFVEIKQRLDRVTQKRRTILLYRDALKLCNQRELPSDVVSNTAVVNEIYTFLWQYNLHPTSVVRYERQAFIGNKYDLGLRVTFDTNPTYQSAPLHLKETPVRLPILPADRVIMEIKVDERIPYWLTELVAAHNLKMVRISKYCRSIEVSNVIYQGDPHGDF